MMDEKFDRKTFLRQLFVSSAVWCVYFLGGLSLGAPTVFLPQIRRESYSTFLLTDDMSSWLSSVLGYSALPWIMFLSILTKYVGRKIPFLIVTATIISAFILFYISQNITQLLISEILLGVIQACSLTISVIIVSEYTAPKYRGLFLTIKSASVFWGIWVSNAIGTFFHWKYIAVFGLICSLYPLTAFVWPESPIWYASRGRFEECRTSHRLLKGVSLEAERELEELIREQCKKEEEIGFVEMVKKKEFYKPVLLSVLMMTQFHFSGKFVCSMYAIEIIKKMTSSESTAYTGMLILDGVTVFSMYFGSALSKFLKRRTLYLTSSFLGAFFLLTISLYLYLVKLSVITESKLLSVLLLAAFNICLGCGPIIFATSIFGEIMPLKYKSSAMIITAFTFNIYSSTLLKLSPMIFKTFGLHGAFLFYGLSVTVYTYLLYLYLPETKDKTLQEIESYFKSKKENTSNTKETSKVDEMNSMIMKNGSMGFRVSHLFIY